MVGLTVSRRVEQAGLVAPSSWGLLILSLLTTLIALVSHSVCGKIKPRSPQE